MPELGQAVRDGHAQLRAGPQVHVFRRRLHDVEPAGCARRAERMQGLGEALRQPQGSLRQGAKGAPGRGRAQV